MAKSTRRTTKNVVTMPRPASTTRVPSQSKHPTDTDIAKRAFELYCERGRQDGRDVEDWLQAERELQETASSTAA
jgi:Protein of unknown function (DUF2934)